MSDNLIVPRIILSVNSVENKTIVNNDGTEISLSLTVIKSFSVLSDFI